MTRTERLLNEATDIARSVFEDPSEDAVMNVFRSLCEEARAEDPADTTPVRRVLH